MSRKKRQGVHRAQRSTRRRWTTISIAAIAACALCTACFYGDRLGWQHRLSPSTGAVATVPGAPAPASTVAAKSLVGNATDRSTPINQSVIDQALKTFESNPSLGTDNSVLIENSDGKTLASLDPMVPRTPASNLKTLTALAIVHTLNMGSTLTTDTYLVSRSGSTGTIVLKGHGDMLLGIGYNDPDHVVGRAGLASLAQETADDLKARKVTSVTLNIDNSLFGSETTPPTMIPGIEAMGDYTPMSSMAINEGKIGLLGSNPDDIKNAYLPRQTDPAGAVSAVFAQLLAKDGITVSPQRGTASDTQMKAETVGNQLGVIHSAPLWEILRLTLQQSDNTLIELLGRLLALKVGAANSTAGATGAVVKIDSRLGIDMNGVHMADCSGLSNGSTATVTALVQVERQYYESANADALEGLSVAGFSGTAREHDFAPDIYGLARLKTGTLGNVTAQSGTILPLKGGLLYFSVIVNNPASEAGAERAIDNFVSALADA
ncbi:MAG: D-alanyl-D-alanine carboxypeptidase [Bifidobacteriaceae bacterium]|nr:D-alanyl-D-alanine carboxypeptidase [Bifidobacteriaceae bacterium]